MRQANGYLYATYFNQSSGAETPTSSSYVVYCNSDGFFRKSSIANMKSLIDTNTWRGIQNNLSSDSTTESLSAAQGKALANGSARDSTKVAKSGDTMTGSLKIDGGGTATTENWNRIYIGNDKAVGTAGNRVGVLTLYAASGRSVYIKPNASTPAGNGEIGLNLPTSAGTLALTSQIKTYTASRGIGITSNNAIYIKGWSTLSATAVNASANTTFRYITNFCFAYQTQIEVSKTSAVSAQLVTIDGSEYYYAPLFSLTAEQATSLVGDNVPTSNGGNTLLCRHENASKYGSSLWRIYRKTASAYYILDESMRVKKASGTSGLNSLISDNYWRFSHIGVLFFIYN